MRISLLLAASACLMAAVLVHLSSLEGRLLRTDPNAIPADPAMMGFGRDRERRCSSFIAPAVTAPKGRPIRRAAFLA